jgi:hypothetical protein
MVAAAIDGNLVNRRHFHGSLKLWINRYPSKIRDVEKPLRIGFAANIKL